MSNQIKYIRDLEAVGFERNQAEAQVQIVLDVLEGDLVTKSDFIVFQEQTKSDFMVFQEQTKSYFAVFQEQTKNQLAQFQAALKESEYRTVIRLGLLTVSTVSIAVAVLTWLIKI